MQNTLDVTADIASLPDGRLPMVAIAATPAVDIAEAHA